VDAVTLVSVGAGAAGVVLGAAGVTKLVDPTPTTRLFDALGLTGSARVAQAAGGVELGLALWLLATGGRWAATATALAYLVLIVLVLTLRRRSPSTPCGCFGQWSGPPSARHVVVNALGASACALAAATDTPVTPPAGTAVAGVVTWWGAVAVAALLGVLALGGRRPGAGAPGRRTPAAGTGDVSGLATNRETGSDGESGHREAQR